MAPIQKITPKVKRIKGKAEERGPMQQDMGKQDKNTPGPKGAGGPQSKNPFKPGSGFTANLLTIVIIFLLLMSVYSYVATTTKSKPVIS